jgi:hypothetical protein
VLRQIALDHPGLTRAVWRLIGDQGAHPEGAARGNAGRSADGDRGHGTGEFGVNRRKGP